MRSEENSASASNREVREPDSEDRKPLSVLDKVVCVLARSIGYSPLASVYIAQFLLVVGIVLASSAIYRLLWKQYDLVGGTITGGKWIGAVILVLLYVAVLLNTSAVEKISEADLTSREERLLPILAWTFVVGLCIVVPAVVMWILV
jgi:hypothetical protein